MNRPLPCCGDPIPPGAGAEIPDWQRWRAADRIDPKPGGRAMQDLKTDSPNGVYVAHCRNGELAYQYDSATGKAVFYPRVIAPGSGTDTLEWRVSAGLGTVYATTVVHTRGADPHNVALIDLDEGFRMMSRVEQADPMAVRIGQRVRVRMHPENGEQPPYPVFVPAEAGA
jgi:uncharacterized OB-fold protein